MVEEVFTSMTTWRGTCRYAAVHANTGALSELFSCGKASTPVITQLASGELLLAKDNIGIFIGTDGKPSRKVVPAMTTGFPCLSLAGAHDLIPTHPDRKFCKEFLLKIWTA